jgi:arylsulfatase A-like enzyme
VDWVNPRATMLPRLLKSVGYATGHFGKWHLSGPFTDAPLPPEYGFDEHAVWTGPTAAKATEFHKVFDDVIAFMRAHQAGPFYVNLWIHQTHAPQVPSEESLKEYAHLDEQHRPYSAAVADGDKGIGRVLAALRELKLEENTIVVFTSDNGPEKTGAERQKELRGGYGTYYSVGTTGGLRGRKRSLFEGGVHLPFFVRWPGHVPAGKLNKTTALAAVDLLPTLCAIADVKLPDSYQADGQNMLPAWLGAQPMRAQPIYWDWRGVETQPETWPRWSVRDGDWKLVIGKDGRRELLHSPDDWSEATDVSKEHPDLVAKLSAKLENWKATLPEKPDPACISKAKPGGRNTASKRDDKKAQTLAAPADIPTPAQRTRSFNRWDSDHDGVLTLDEYKAGLGNPSNAERRFKNLDQNGDGKLTLEEFVNRSSR